jgi:flavin-dependent dehydrogenase
MPSTDTYDVVICGAGLAGLTLARQLRLTLPDRSVCLIDKETGPFPAAAFKIGESTVEVASFYLAEILDLKPYFERAHLRKLGLRYFFGDPQMPFHTRPEFGLSDFPPFNAYQIDRGLLESDLREIVRKDGVDLLEGRTVEQIELAEGDEPHTITCRDVDGGSEESIRGRWVVDASGRRRLLQQKLDLGRRCSKKRHSSAWFRLEGRIDVTDFVPRSEREWHERVSNDFRYHSTCHLMGNGRWVWIIPLSSGCTSIGIVTDEDIHGFEGYSTFERATRWLETHEPVLAAHIAGREPLDFLAMRNYSHSTKKAFSHERWACVGEAAVFPDPVYSQGSDLVSIANTVVTRLIELSFSGDLSEELVHTYDRFFVAQSDFATHSLQLSYPFHGRDIVMACKFLWDVTTGWAFACPLLFSGYALDPKAFAEVQSAKSDFAFLSLRMNELFTAWAEKTERKHSFDFLDYLSVPVVRSVYERNLQKGKPVAEVVADHEASMKTFEELSQAIFLLAVEDVCPEELGRFKDSSWLNAWKISLDPSNWEGLFEPTTKPGNLAEVRRQIRGCFQLSD